MNIQDLKILRKEKKVKIKDLASSTGLNRDTISRIENGTGEPSFKNVQLIIEELGYEIMLLRKK